MFDDDLPPLDLFSRTFEFLLSRDLAFSAADSLVLTASECRATIFFCVLTKFFFAPADYMFPLSFSLYP